MNFGRPVTRLILGCNLLWATSSLPAAGAEAAKASINIGRVKLVPEGFFEVIGEWRSETTADNVWTSFGKIPLRESPSESLISLQHSRPMIHIEIPIGQVKLITYLESDFMVTAPGAAPFRWRQYWTEAKIGHWEVLGGQAWSLLRPNRKGIEPERALMNTDVVEPNYHVGLAGMRRRQLRIAYGSEDWKAAAAWEGTYGLFVGKFAKEIGNTHLEAAAFTGRYGQRGVSFSESVGIHPKVRVVAQQFASRRALAEALGIVPRGVSGSSFLFGAELPLTKQFEVYSYYGFLLADNAPGNHLVHQYSVGVNQKIKSPFSYGSMMLGAQYSRVDRSLWTGPQGAMDYIETRFRYTFN